jgi:general secretion pathway protein D
MTAQTLQRFTVALLLCATIAAAQAPPASSRMTPNFQNQDIALVAEAVGNATGVTFVIDPRVRANITLINSRAMSPRELYETFLSILQVNNFAAVRSGNIVKIVPDSSVRTLPGNDVPERVNPDSDEMVTTVIEVKNVSAAQLNQVLRPLVATYGTISPAPGTNALLITDRAANVARIQRIVQRIDRASSSEVDVIRLENASAADVVRTLSALTAGTGGGEAGGIAPRVVADERSNSVLVSGEPGQRLRIAAWIANLDTPLDSGGGTEVFYLKYADAEKVATRLKEQAGGIVAAASGAAGGAQANAAASDRNIIIGSDKQTNAVIISAPPKSMRQFKSIIDKLDIPRAQVLVEAIIADVSTDKSADLGVNWAVFSNEDGTSVPAGGFISPIAGSSIVDLTRGIVDPTSVLAPGANIPLGATFGIGQLRDNGINFGVMIRALRSDTNTNVIATPQITTADNQEATFESGQEVPFITGQYTNTSGNNNGSVNPFSTVQRQQVGTKLKITPQLNGANAMTLTIELESSELAGSTGDVGSAITNVRKFKNTVLVQDGQTIVVGGMIRDSKITGQNRVPFLSRIPIIGEAFKVKNGKRQQSNLMVFLRPRILTDSVQATLETNQKYNLIRDAQIKQGERGELLPILPFDKPPQLPPAQAPAAPAPAAPPPAGPAAPATTTPVP